MIRQAILALAIFACVGCSTTQRVGPITPEEQREMQVQAERRTWVQLLISLIPSAIILSR